MIRANRLKYGKLCFRLYNSFPLSLENRFVSSHVFCEQPPIVIEGLELFNTAATVLSGHLETRQYIVQNHVTLADFSVAVPMVYAAAGRLPLDPYPAIREWYKRIEKIESWRKSLP